MSDKLPGMEEAQRRFEDSRWEISTPYAVNETICIDILRSLIGFRSGAIYVKKPNILESAFGITFNSKVRKAICKQQKRCDKLNREIDVNYKLEAIAKSILEEVKSDE